jgi:putative DNA methylase
VLLDGYDVRTDPHTSAWEALHHLIRTLERDGITPAGDFLRDALHRSDGAVESDLVKELAGLLFSVAEKNGWTQDAIRFNNVATSWPDILRVARETRSGLEAQRAFELDEGDD